MFGVLFRGFLLVIVLVVVLIAVLLVLLVAVLVVLVVVLVVQLVLVFVLAALAKLVIAHVRRAAQSAFALNARIPPASTPSACNVQLQRFIFRCRWMVVCPLKL